jgi:hypothetical protein
MCLLAHLWPHDETTAPRCGSLGRPATRACLSQSVSRQTDRGCPHFYPVWQSYTHTGPGVLSNGTTTQKRWDATLCRTSSQGHAEHGPQVVLHSSVSCAQIFPDLNKKGQIPASILIGSRVAWLCAHFGLGLHGQVCGFQRSSTFPRWLIVEDRVDPNRASESNPSPPRTRRSTGSPEGSGVVLQSKSA